MFCLVTEICAFKISQLFIFNYSYYTKGNDFLYTCALVELLIRKLNLELLFPTSFIVQYVSWIHLPWINGCILSKWLEDMNVLMPGSRQYL